MFILRFADKDDNLSCIEFDTNLELKEYITKNNIDKIWHQIEQVKKVIPNIIREEDK